MSTKYVIITVIVVFIILIIASYTRYINIDAVFRANRTITHPQNIHVSDLAESFNYGSNGRVLIEGYPLRSFSSCIPPVLLVIALSKDGKHIIISDSAGHQFLLGSIVSSQLKDNSYTVAFEQGDKVTFKSSFSLVPYYYGFFILSPGAISRYYHYYSFYIKKESGSSLLLEWKFSTYKDQDGKLAPDLFGDNQEGLTYIKINDN